MTEQRRLAAIVFADVAGYSDSMGRDEAGTLAALEALRRKSSIQRSPSMVGGS